MTDFEAERIGPPSIGAEGDRTGRTDKAEVTAACMSACGANADGEWPTIAVLEDADRRVTADPVVAVRGESVVISAILSIGIVNLGKAGRPYSVSNWRHLSNLLWCQPELQQTRSSLLNPASCPKDRPSVCSASTPARLSWLRLPHLGRQ